jgi:hypothetical protein
MKIRWLTSLGGTCDGAPIVSGSEADIGESSALEYIARGQAEAVAAPEVKTEAVEAPRNAAARIGKPKPRKAVN